MSSVNAGCVCVYTSVHVCGSLVTGSEPRHRVSIVFMVPGAGSGHSAHTDVK